MEGEPERTTKRRGLHRRPRLLFCGAQRVIVVQRLRIVVLTSESLPANVITETLLREVPGRVVGIVVSTAFERGVRAPRALWRHARRMGPWFFAVVVRGVLGIRMLWWLRRMRRSVCLPPDLRRIAAKAAIPLIPTSGLQQP